MADPSLSSYHRYNHPYYVDPNHHYAAYHQPPHGNIEPVGSRRPSYSNDLSLETGNSSNAPSAGNSTVPSGSNTSVAASDDSFTHHWSSPLPAPFLDASVATSAAVPTASHMRTEAPVNGLNGMINHTSVSTPTRTTALPSSISSMPIRPAPSFAQPNQSNSNPTPSLPVSTQSSGVHSHIMPTFPHLPSPNMITSAPSALSLPLLLPPQSGASTSGSSMHAVLQTTLQIQPNPILPQQPILPHFVGDDEPVVCVICGGICKITDDFDDDHIYNRTPHWMRPILVQAKPEYLEWQKQRPSTRRSYCNNVELIEQTQVTAFLGGSQGMKLESETLYINTTDLLMRIPIHLSCFKIADIFCKDQTRYRIGFRDASGGAPSSIPQLYEIWCKRAIASHPGGLMSKPILEANMYFGAPAPSCSNMADYDKAMVKDPSLRRFLAYPLTISGLTDIVVNSNLQTMDGKERRPCNELAQLLDRIQDMPQEIFDQITGALEPFEENRGPPLQPTRVLPPNWWKRRLLSGKLIPWLWDLDENDVFRYRAKNFYEHNHNDAVQDQKRGEYIFDENMWDWELLCRQLAQFNVMERGGLLEGESKQLWNRRRIWKLLDAARLGHIPLP